jgi:hypothetical protein
MANQPICPLCQARLVKREGIYTGFYGVHPLAWVCPDCSAAFPIALRVSRFGWWFRARTPLFQNGIDSERFSASPGAQSDDRIQRMERLDEP